MDNNLHQRKSPRLKDYHYAEQGAYLVTICTHQRLHLFGQIKNDKCVLTELGEIAKNHWLQIITHYDHITLDEYVIMPNHIHGIIFIGLSGKSTLGVIIGAYKAGVTRQAHQIGYGDSPIWQGRYHDHIIRNEADYLRVKSYVIENPSRWQDDTFYSG